MASGDPQPWAVVEAVEAYLCAIVLDSRAPNDRLVALSAMTEDQLAGTSLDRRLVVAVKTPPYPPPRSGAPCVELMSLEVSVVYAFGPESRRRWLADSRIIDRALRIFRGSQTWGMRSRVTGLEPDVTIFESDVSLLARWQLDVEYHVEA
jgi:hypothetical protein